MNRSGKYVTQLSGEAKSSRFTIIQNNYCYTHNSCKRNFQRFAIDLNIKNYSIETGEKQ